MQEGLKLLAALMSLVVLVGFWGSVCMGGDLAGGDYE